MKLRSFGIIPLVALVALVFLAPAAGQITPQTPAPDLAALDVIVAHKAATISDWEAAARIQIYLTIAAILFGGLVTILQPWSSKSWCKGANATLGLAIAIVTGVTGKAFPVDYRVYQRSALKAQANLSGAKDDIALLKARPSADEAASFKADFTQRMKAIGDIETKLSGDDKVAGLFPDFDGVVYAQSNKPVWVTKPPTSPSSVYFVGTGEGHSLSEAKANSFLQALGQAAQYLTSRLQFADGDAALEFARSSTSVEDTAFTVDAQQQTYHYYTLTRLDKALSSAGVVNALAPPSCPSPRFPQAAPTGIDSACSAAGAQIDGARSLENLAKNNFCAAEPAKPITIADMVALQKRAAISGINFGNPARHPLTSKPGPVVNRKPLVTLGEGNEVVLQGYVLLAHQEGPESMNCGRSVPDSPAYHDIHISIVDATTNANECSGVVVEMSPHHRPALWTQQNVKSIGDKHLLVRVTGQLMFDSSHTPCVAGVPTMGDAGRASLWTVTPIYKFEVCPGGGCVSGGWITLEAWVEAGAH